MEDYKLRDLRASHTQLYWIQICTFGKKSHFSRGLDLFRWQSVTFFLIKEGPRPLPLAKLHVRGNPSSNHRHTDSLYATIKTISHETASIEVRREAPFAARSGDALVC